MQENLLIVEDDKNLGQTLYEYLLSKKYICQLARSAQDVRQAFKTSPIPSIVLMDIELPDGSGLELAAELKQKHPQLMILFLSAHNNPHIRVEGLEIGAEDFIGKPFDLRELTLRLERCLNTRSNPPDEIQIGRLKFRLSSFEIEDAFGKVHHLSQKESGILEYLLRNKSKAITREEIIEAVWGCDSYPSNRTVDNFIVRFRKWFETDKSGPVEIVSVRGIGYKLNLKEGENHGSIR